MEEINWFQIQIKKIKLFFIYRKFKRSETYKNAKMEFEQRPKYWSGLEFDESFDKVLVKNKYLLDTLEIILLKNNLEIKEDIDPKLLNSIFRYVLYKNSSEDQPISFYSTNSFSAAERIYFYVLENYK